MTYPDPAQSPTAGGTGPAFGPQGYYQAPPPPIEKRRNTVGRIALIAAIVGFIFGCIPGALIVGWILLPVAFILGIVGLFQAGQKKGTSISAIVISVIGTIVAAVVFLTVVSDAVDDAFTPDTATVSQNGEEQSNDAGSRQNPAKIGATLTGKDWTVVVNEYTPDATDQVMAENEFNDEPEADQEYALVNLTVTYTGDGSDFAEFISVAFVGDDGKTYNQSDSMAVAPDALEGELYKGGTATGNVELAVPKNATGVIRIGLGVFDDEAFVAVP